MKMLRFSGLACLAVSLVILLILGAACISGSSGHDSPVVNNTTAADVGIVPIPTTGTGQQETFTLEEAASAVVAEEQAQGNGSLSTPSILYIRGENVNASGLAGRWIFGTSEGNETMMLVYDKNGIERIAFDTNAAPGPGIDLSDILSPAEAIKIADPAVQNTTGSFDLELVNGEYTVTGPAGSQSREYIVNATTGVSSAS